MRTAERSVLHVLPHRGGGGDTYVDVLSDMPAYRFSRAYLAPSPAPSIGQLARGVGAAIRRARRHELLHVHGEAAGGLCLPVLATRPSVVTLHGLHLTRRLSGLQRKASVLNLRAVLRAADRTICVAETEHDLLVALVGAAAAQRAVVVRNGVRPPPATAGSLRAEIREELGVSEAEPLAIWVGSLDERKDPQAAIRAAERAGVALLVVGDGPLRAEVERAAHGPVHALGRRDDVPCLLAAADLFVVTSHREGLSLSLLEAMAFGLPAIVTDLPENVEAIGDAGIRYEGDDALVAALKRLMANRDERTALGERAQRRVAELFSAEELIERTRVVYEEVLA